MVQAATKVVALLSDPKVRRERDLAAKWAKLDELEKQLRALKQEIAPLQRQVGLDRGFVFPMSREALERPAKVIPEPKKGATR